MAHTTSAPFGLFSVPPKPTAPCPALLEDGTVCGHTRFWLKNAHTAHATWVCWIGWPPPLIVVCEATEGEADRLHETITQTAQETARQLALEGMDV